MQLSRLLWRHLFLLLLFFAEGIAAQPFEFPKLRTNDTWVYRQSDTRTAFGAPPLHIHYTVGRHCLTNEVALLARLVPSNSVHKVYQLLPDDSCVVDVVAGETLFRDRPCPDSLKPGEKWSSEVKSAGKVLTHSYQYDGVEEVTTPMRTFQAHKIVGEGSESEESVNGDVVLKRRFNTTWWYSPKVHGMVRVQRRIADVQTGRSFVVVEELIQTTAPGQ